MHVLNATVFLYIDVFDWLDSYVETDMQQDNSLRWSDGSSVVYNKYGSIEQVTRRIDCGYVSAGYKLTPLSNEFDNVMLSKSPKTFQRPQKPRQGDQLIHRRSTKSSPQ